MNVCHALFIILMVSGTAIAQTGGDKGKAWYPISPLTIPSPVAPQTQTAPSTQRFFQDIEALERNASESALLYQGLQNRVLQSPTISQQPHSSLTPEIGGMPKKEDGFRYFLAGRYFWRGENGYPKDIPIALVLLRRAVQAEYPPATYQLGKLYLTGRGRLRKRKIKHAKA